MVSLSDQVFNYMAVMVGDYCFPHRSWCKHISGKYIDQPLCVCSIKFISISLLTIRQTLCLPTSCLSPCSLYDNSVSSQMFISGWYEKTEFLRFILCCLWSLV